MKIKCLSNGFSSLKNSHNPFGKGFQLPPYGKIPVEHFSYVVNWVNWSYSCREIFLYRYSSEWKFISGTNFGGKRAGNMAHGVKSGDLTHFCKCDCSVKQRVTAASDGGAMFCSNAKMSRIGGAVEKKRSTFGTFRPTLAKPTVQFRTQPKDNSSTLLRIFSLLSFCTFPLKTLAMFVIIKHHCKRVLYGGLGSPLPPIIFHDRKSFDLTGLLVCELTRN